MKENIRHGITVGECSQVVEVKNHAPQHWHRDFREGLMRKNKSIYRLVGTVMNEHYPPIQGYAHWCRFYDKDLTM